MTFGDGYIFIGNEGSVLRFPYTGQEKLTGTGEKIATLPEGGHGTRNVLVNGTKVDLDELVETRSGAWWGGRRGRGAFEGRHATRMR